MKGVSVREKIVSVNRLPELLLAVSVLSVSPPWIKFLISAAEHGSGELWLILSIVLAVVPALLLILADIEHLGRSDRLGKLGKHLNLPMIERGYSLFLGALLSTQVVLTGYLWLEVQALELTGALLRFYVLTIPFNSIAVLVLTTLFVFSEPRTRVHSLQIILGALLVAFSIFAIGEVSSMLTT